MTIDKLINDLSSEGARRPLPGPMRQTLLWGAPTFGYFIVFGLFLGLRPDIGTKFAEPSYIAELVFLLGITLSAAVATCCLSRPDSHQKPWIKYIPLALLIPWGITAFANASGEFSIADLMHTARLGRYDCPLYIALFSLPPGIALFFIARTGATIRCCWAGSMATFAVTAMAYLMMRCVEPNDNIAHLFIWHVMPIMLFCIAGMVIGHFSLKWRGPEHCRWNQEP